jgi:hypothetical protein
MGYRRDPAWPVRAASAFLPLPVIALTSHAWAPSLSHSTMQSLERGNVEFPRRRVACQVGEFAGRSPREEQ